MAVASEALSGVDQLAPRAGNIALLPVGGHPLHERGDFLVADALFKIEDDQIVLRLHAHRRVGVVGGQFPQSRQSLGGVLALAMQPGAG
jgi:hypothetical protein